MQEQNIQTATSERNRTAFKPQLMIYQPNGKGTGGAAILGSMPAICFGA